MLSIRNLNFSFRQKAVLRDISIEFKRETYTVILGKNGSGKTTLLKIMAGLLGCPKNCIFIDNKDLIEYKDRERARLIGYLPQMHSPAFAFKVIDVVLTGRASYVITTANQKDIQKSESAIQMVGIGHLIDRNYTELSGGERQMVMMARLLAQEPEIMLLDEPMTHLDLPNQMRMSTLIDDLVKKGHTVISVMHDPNTALNSAKEFVFIKDGQIIEHNSPFSMELFKEVYDIDVIIADVVGRKVVLTK